MKSKYEWRCGLTGWHSLTGDENWSNDPILGCYAKEILHLATRVEDLEDVIRERGDDTPEPAEVDREAFEQMDAGERFLAYREAAGWALQARAWEKEAGSLAARVTELEAAREKLEGASRYAIEGQRKIRESLKATGQWTPRDVDGTGGTAECAVAVIEGHARLEERAEALNAVIAPLLPLFRDFVEIYGPYRDVASMTSIELTAEFPVEALRALINERNEQKEEG